MGDNYRKEYASIICHFLSTSANYTMTFFKVQRTHVPLLFRIVEGEWPAQSNIVFRTMFESWFESLLIYLNFIIRQISVEHAGVAFSSTR
jgi:hypothetical protein